MILRADQVWNRETLVLKKITFKANNTGKVNKSNDENETKWIAPKWDEST